MLLGVTVLRLLAWRSKSVSLTWGFCAFNDTLQHVWARTLPTALTDAHLLVSRVEKKHLWIAFASYRNIIASFSNLGSTEKHMQLVKTETSEVVPDLFLNNYYLSVYFPDNP